MLPKAVVERPSTVPCVELEETAERKGEGCEDERAKVSEAATVGTEGTGVDVVLTLLA